MKKKTPMTTDAPPSRWVETMQMRKSTDESGKVKLELLVINSWPDKYCYTDKKTKLPKTGKLISLEVPDGDLKDKLIRAYEHPEESSPKWKPALK